MLLKKEVETLKNDLTDFIKSTETFQNILGSQNESTKKSGLGFKDPSKIIESFVPKKAEMKIKCSFCDRLGHNESCFMSLEKDKWIWHKRAGHVSMKTIAKLSQLDLVRGLPKISFEKDKICEACVKGKQKLHRSCPFQS